MGLCTSTAKILSSEIVAEIRADVLNKEWDKAIVKLGKAWLLYEKFSLEEQKALDAFVAELDKKE